MSELWRRITRIGIDASLGPTEVKHIAFVNAIALLAIVAAVARVPFGIAIGAHAVVFLGVLVSGLYGLTWLFNARRRHWGAAVYIHVLAVVTYTTLTVVLGSGIAAHHVLLIPAFLPFLAFPARQLRSALVLSGFALVAFTVLVLQADQLDGIVEVPHVEVLRLFNLLSLGVFLAIMGLYARKTTLDAERRWIRGSYRPLLGHRRLHDPVLPRLA